MKDMKDYFPDEYPKGRKCAREYFFTVLASLHPEYIGDLLLKCKKDWLGVDQGQSNKEAVVMCTEWERQLKEFPGFDSKSLLSPSNSYCY